ncbi:MAG TPA: hypothetical protein DCM05_11070 [Elusimicrobia bacterium]|nr:hypothetical protein [Elusimicrobiota bacterium]
MVTIPFSEGAVERQVEKDEADTYREMLARALVPRYLLLEASVNPLPLAGVALRSGDEEIYRRFKFSPTLNLIEAGTAGFEEPYAFSAFLGKVVNFEGRETLGHRNIGYVGYLASCGNYHLMESQLFPDNWVEVEAKVKGLFKTDKKSMSWSFRGGAKLHNNQDIADVFYFGVRRDRVDFEKTPWSWLLSAAVSYQADFSRKDFTPLQHSILVEKNWPLKKNKLTLSMGVGYLWRGTGKYTGTVAEHRTLDKSQILLRPNLKF